MSKETDYLINQLSTIIVNLEQLSSIDNQILADHRVALRNLLSSDNGLDDVTKDKIRKLAFLDKDGFIDINIVQRRF